MRIVFMGTPDFAVASLTEIAKKHSVVGVFTQPDKAVGRKQILTPPAVKVKAEQLGIPVYQPTTLKDGTALSVMEELSPDAVVVAAYGKFLPAEILHFPKYGCINVHGSLLPKLRGASPIQWSIVTGERETGITTMLMNEGMDTGDMLEKAVLPIEYDDTFETLHDKLADLGAGLVCSTLEKLEQGEITPVPQNESFATYAPIIKKEMGRIDFSKTADEIRNLVRAFNPWPSAFTFIDGKRLKVLSATVADCHHSGECGILIDNKNGICVSAGNGTAITLDRVQLEGSKACFGADLLKGHRLEKGMKFGE